MKVRFEMSGGYGGIYAAEPLTAEVDSEVLPDGERADVRRMAKAAMAAVPSPDPLETVPDLMTYRLEIMGEDRWEVVLDDRTLPEEVSPLIDYMRTKAIQKRTEQQ